MFFIVLKIDLPVYCIVDFWVCDELHILFLIRPLNTIFTKNELERLSSNITVEVFSRGAFPAVEHLMPNPQSEYMIVQKLAAIGVSTSSVDTVNLTSLCT